MQSAVLLLKTKYSLVHVPSSHKAELWADETLRLIHEGYPREQAGMEAARRIFRHEYREHSVYEGAPVNQILPLIKKDNQYK